MFNYVCKNKDCAAFGYIAQHTEQRKGFINGIYTDKTAPCPMCQQPRTLLNETKKGFATVVTGRGFGNTCNK